jgi:hypothetical protein
MAQTLFEDKEEKEEEEMRKAHKSQDGEFERKAPIL